MPEGEGQRPPQTEAKLGPNPITHTPDGWLRRRSDPHGLTRGEQAEIYLMRAGTRIEDWLERYTSPKQSKPIPTPETDQPETTPHKPIEPTTSDSLKAENEAPVTESLHEEDPLRFGADVPASTIRVMRALNWIGDWFGRNVADRILGPRENLPLVRRPEFQYKHDMRVQKGTSAPSSVRVVEPAKEPPYDWNDMKRGDPDVQDNPVIETTESGPYRDAQQ